MENIFYCVYQAHYLYKIANNSFILKPKCLAAILRKSDSFLQKDISNFNSSKFYTEYFLYLCIPNSYFVIWHFIFWCFYQGHYYIPENSYFSIVV